MFEGDTDPFWLKVDELLQDEELGEIVVVTQRLADVDDSGMYARYYEIADWTLTHYETISEETARSRYERTGRKKSCPKPSMNPWVRQQMADAGFIEQSAVEPSGSERNV